MKDQEKIVEKIRAEYTLKEVSALDELKALDARVKRPANVFGYVYGCLGAMIMGTGMSMVMTDIGDILGLKDAMPLGVAMGLVGIVMVLSTYTLYKRILTSRKNQYAAEILALSEKVLQG
jgi:hypothetical protein